MSKPVRTRKVSLRGLAYAVAGAEPKYDVYRFSNGRRRYERPGHNPFAEYVGMESPHPGFPDP